MINDVHESSSISDGRKLSLDYLSSPPRPPKLLHSFPHAEHMLRQRQAATLFNNRDQLVELWAGVRAGDDDPDRMEQFFPLHASLCLRLIHEPFELFGCEAVFTRTFVFQYFENKAGENCIGVRQCEDFCIAGRGWRSIA